LFVIFRSISIKPYAPNGVARRKTAFLAHADTIPLAPSGAKKTTSSNI